jgi:hypothetical protein
MYSLEGPLIREYWSQPNAQRLRSAIGDYARLMHMSDGRAQDALDLWVHLLTQVTARIQ